MENKRLRAKILIKMDVGDLVDRLFIPAQDDRYIGISNLFQDGVKLTVLDKRPFNPPIESPTDRVQNLKNVMETFGISKRLINQLVKVGGCKSIALIALIGIDHLYRCFQMSRDDFVKISTMLRMINCSALEPLYSINRLAHHNLVKSQAKPPCQHLDLAEVKVQESYQSKPAMNKFYSIMTLTTFNSSNDKKFGRQRGCRGLEHHVEHGPNAPMQILFLPYGPQSKDVPHPYFACSQPQAFDRAYSTSSGSSDSLNAEITVPLDVKLEPPCVIKPKEKRNKKVGLACPFLNCPGRTEDLSLHLYNSHNKFIVENKLKTFIGVPHPNSYIYKMSLLENVGYVEMAVEAQIMEPQYVWWGPKCFECHGIRFFLVLDKWEAPDQRLLFHVKADADGRIARNYYTGVDILNPQPNWRNLSKVYRCRVASLSKKESARSLEAVYFRFVDLDNYIFPDGKIRFRLGLYRSIK